MVVIAIAACSARPMPSPVPSTMPSGSPQQPAPTASPAVPTGTPMPLPSPTNASLPDLAVLQGSWAAGGRSGRVVVIHAESQLRLDGTIAADVQDGPLPCARKTMAVGISAVRTTDGPFRLGPYSASHDIDADKLTRWSLTLERVDATSAAGSFHVTRGQCDSGEVPWSASLEGTGADALGPLPIDPRELRRVRDLLRCWAMPGCTD